LFSLFAVGSKFHLSYSCERIGPLNHHLTLHFARNSSVIGLFVCRLYTSSRETPPSVPF